MSRPALVSYKRQPSGRVPTMKGCLKSPLPSPGAESSPVRKTVAFGEEGTEEVYFADVWDRTPTEPARKLTYQDLLELKEIQRSLPRANQLADPVSGRPASHFLQDVPIGLLPLLSETDSSSSRSSSTTTSPAISPPTTPSGTSNPTWIFSPPLASPPKPQPVASAPWVPPHLAHLAPKRQAPPRPKPTFSFLPLLDTPPSSGASSPYTSLPSSRSPSPDRDIQSDTDPSLDPPTPSLTNASLDSSPLSRASSASPEPSFLQLPPLRGKGVDNYDDMGYSHYTYPDPSTILSPRMEALKFGRMRSSSPPPPPPSTAWHAFPDRSKKRHTSVSPQRSDTSSDYNPPRRRRNVMIVNGIEIDLDDDDDFASAVSTPGASSSRCAAAEEATPRRAGTSPPASSTPTRLSPDIDREQMSCLLSCPTPLACSPPNRCTKSLCSPIRFKRDSKSQVLPQQGYQHKMGPQGPASP
ncbi:hypothetical protein D9615_003815 [Tricholomella constricta]|uniref:Uncharacterized protein n=1 Tax=Tricholomella constricta TaxID=117010 RepID=A0A8H5HI57_9AGAR|nr:hypothetical protein D9615_003815 [Tricholomella constricta]